MSQAQTRETAEKTKQPTWSKQLIWDLPTRLFHWLLTVCVLGAYLLARSPAPWFYWHVVLGTGAGLLIIWRIVWGFVGTKHARFGTLSFSVRSVLNYFRSIAGGKGQYYPAHNPAGSLGIWMMLVLTALTVATGFGTASETFEDLHKLLANLLLVVVVFHIAGVLLASAMHHENYLASMFSGRKTAPVSDAISNSRPVAAVILLAFAVGGMAYVVAGLNFQTGTFTAPGTSFTLHMGEAEGSESGEPGD